MSETPVASSAIVRLLWKVAGCTFLVIGLIGIVVPLLPTTPFLLLAAYCFQRGSERLHRWLLEHPRFGPLIVDWRERGAIAPKAKWSATIAIILVFAFSVFLGLAWHLLLIQGVVLSLVTVFILTRPH